MKTLLTVRIASEIKTNLQTEADALNTTLSRHAAKILNDYDQSKPTKPATKTPRKGNLSIGTIKKSTKATNGI